jgi:hypothetical protein
MPRRPDPGSIAGHPLRLAADALALAPMLDRRPVLVASDFDGTLSHLTMDPWGARILPLARRSLRDLAVTTGTHVALISGRTAADLTGRVRIGGATYLGNHGVGVATCRGSRANARIGSRRCRLASPRSRRRWQPTWNAIPSHGWSWAQAAGSDLPLPRRSDVAAAGARVTQIVNATDPQHQMIASRPPRWAAPTARPPRRVVRPHRRASPRGGVHARRRP